MRLICVVTIEQQPRGVRGMWRVKNDTPYASGRIWGRDKDGVHEWIVVVKGTFDIHPGGKLVRAAKQMEPLLVAESQGEDGKSSLRYEADLVGPKPTTDILLNGTAYAPRGRPATEFLVSMRVGDVHKQIKVVGDRYWKSGLLGIAPSAAQPVVECPSSMNGHMGASINLTPTQPGSASMHAIR